MANFEALIDGFLSRVKQAGKADLVLHRIGKGKSYMVGGRQAPGFMINKLLSQPAVAKDINRVAKLHGIAAEQVEDNTRAMWMRAKLTGTI